MMGRRERGQGQFFYRFDLDKVVPTDHLVRQIDGVLDLDWVHKELAPYYSHTGRPSIDPVLMIRMLLVGYVFAIRSERRLCSEVQVNLAYRWFCKLGIEDGIPDHSVFSRARHERFRQSDTLRRVFEGVVSKCIAAGLVGGEGFSIDASLIKADAGRKQRVPGDEPIAWPRAEEASRAVREYLAALDAFHSLSRRSHDGPPFFERMMHVNTSQCVNGPRGAPGADWHRLHSQPAGCGGLRPAPAPPVTCPSTPAHLRRTASTSRSFPI